MDIPHNMDRAPPCPFTHTHNHTTNSPVVACSHDRHPTPIGHSPAPTNTSSIRRLSLTHGHIHNRMYGLHMVTPLTQLITPLVTTQHQHQSISPWLVGLHVSIYGIYIHGLAFSSYALPFTHILFFSPFACVHNGPGRLQSADGQRCGDGNNYSGRLQSADEPADSTAGG